MKNYSKHITIITAFLLINGFLAAQNAIPVKVNDTSIIKIINHVRTFHQYEVKDLWITIMNITNPSGSANLPETEEVTSNIYLGVSEIDTYPEESLFCIKNLYAVTNIKMEKTISEGAIIVFNYIDISNQEKPIKKEMRVKLTLHDAVIIK